MTAPDPDDLIRRSDDIAEKYLSHWVNDAAKAELAAIWGMAINDSGVLVNASEEVLYHHGNHKASITIGTANGVFAFGCSFSTPLQGYGGAPSIWGELYATHGEARTAAIEFLLKRFPETGYPYEGSPREHLERMREAVADLLRQPSLF